MKAHGGVIFLEIIAVEVIMDFCKNLMQCKLLGEKCMQVKWICSSNCLVQKNNNNILTICAKVLSQLLFLFSFLLRSQTFL